MDTRVKEITIEESLEIMKEAVEYHDNDANILTVIHFLRCRKNNCVCDDHRSSKVLEIAAFFFWCEIKKK